MAETHGTEAERHRESLAVCLRAVLTGFGVRRPYDELVSTLGLGAATVAAPDDSLDSWATYARDAGLVPTANLYGLCLRDLHPPNATPGLGRSAEYPEHFHDSYVPLIMRALEHDQLVLAWRGWPAPGERLWGVITRARGDQLFGQMQGCGDELVPLAGPAHQVYIVEESRPPNPNALSPDALFAHVARQASAAWAGRWVSDRGALTGPAAYKAWQDFLRRAPNANTLVPPLHQQHRHTVRLLVAARKCLSAWLRGVPGRHRDLAAVWANTCDRVRQLLEQDAVGASSEGAFEQTDGIERACQVLADVCELETELVKRLEPIR